MPNHDDGQITIRMRGETAEVLVYDEIGGDPYLGGGITAKEFRDQVQKIKAKRMTLRHHCMGGSVPEAAAILATLDDWPGRIEVDVDGYAASAGSVVAMAGDTIRVASNGMMMIHNPYASVIGGAEKFRQMADLLDSV